MKIKKHILSLIVIFLLYSAWAVSAVSAHALLVRSTPEANAVLETPPVQVEIFFSEPLEPTVSSISVFDPNNKAVDAGDVRVDPSNPLRMTVTLHSLPDGVYTVTWTALSTVDGHQSVGTFPFAVGNANAEAVRAIAQSSTARLPFTALASKFLLLASLALLIGQRFFVALVWDPALKSNQIDRPAVWITFYRIGLIGILIGIGIGMLSQAGQTTGSELTWPWSIHTGHILAQTRLGVLWLLRLVLAMLAVWFAYSSVSSLKLWLGFIVNLALLLTVTLTSHAATDARPFFPILGDWLHLVGMTFWLGGLVYLFTGIRHLQKLDGPLRTTTTSLLTSRFSINAILFVSLIGVTGFYSAYLRVGSWTGLLTSLYGHVLLVKQAFVAGLLTIAAINLLIISPRLTRERLQGTTNSTLLSRFGKILAVELTLAGLLLASVSFLTYVPPTKAPVIISDLSERITVDDLRIDINIAPGRVGQNTFTLRLTSDDQPVPSAKEVLLRFTPKEGTIPPSELELVSLGDGSFTAKGVHLSSVGDWEVQAVVRREGKFDTFANFDFDIRNPGSSDETASIPRQAAVLIMLIGALCALLTVSLDTDYALRLGAGLPMGLTVIALGIFYLNNPVAVITDIANPVPANPESVATGQTLFSTHCASCHGDTGKGDGPIGVTLNPRPADLTQHAIPGIHPDSQLFEWITNGFPGSRMPAFKTALSDTDRWHLVNFIRTLSPQ